MKRFKRLLILLVLTVLTIFALSKLGDVELNVETMARVQWGWMAVVIAIFYATIVGRGTRWQHILRAMGWPTPLKYTTTLMMAGLFISAILPARLGDVGRVAMLKQDYKIPIAQGIASIATERALDIFSILVLTIIGGLWALQGRIPGEYVPVMLGTALLFIIGLIGLLAMPRLEGWFRNPFPHWQTLARFTVPPHKTGRLYQKILDFAFAMIHGVRALGQHPLILMMVLLESLYIWFGEALLIHFALVSINAAVPLGVTLFSMMVSDLIAAVPLTPGAIGQFEVALAGILTVLGVNRADSILGVILLRLVSFWTLIPVSGLITYIFGFARALDLNPATLMAKESAPAPPVSSPTPLEG